MSLEGMDYCNFPVNPYVYPILYVYPASYTNSVCFDMNTT